MIGTELIISTRTTQSVSLDTEYSFYFLHRRRNFAGKEFMQAQRDKRKIYIAVKRLLVVLSTKYRWTAWKFVRAGQKWLNSGTF